MAGGVALVGQTFDAAGDDRGSAVRAVAEIGLGQGALAQGLEDLEFGERRVEVLLQVLFDCGSERGELRQELEQVGTVRRRGRRGRHGLDLARNA